jgi:hypothetical protein
MPRNVSIDRTICRVWRPADFWLPDKDIAFLHFLVKDPSEMLNKYAGNPLMVSIPMKVIRIPNGS